MTEREALTIFRTIQKCRHQALHTNDCGNCERCQYRLEQEQIDGAVALAISALEKQIPKKPVIGYAFPDKLREVMKRTDPEKAETKTDCCPVCGRTLGVSKFVQTQTGLRFGDPHCKRCGQAIDWEEE